MYMQDTVEWYTTTEEGREAAKWLVRELAKMNDMEVQPNYEFELFVAIVIAGIIGLIVAGIFVAKRIRKKRIIGWLF